MANIQPEDAENSLWQRYSLHTPTSAGAPPPTFETSYTPGPLGMPYHGLPQKGNYRPLEVPSTPTRGAPGVLGAGNEVLTASPPLNTHHSYPSLKRSFQSTEDSAYREVAPDFREELPDPPKPSINQDHRLLSFSKIPLKQTILDDHGRIHQIELSAQIHGMFFLSEMATPSGDGILQPELTCYRRNLFQISGTVTTPRGPLSVITERGERFPIMAMEVCVSASESVDGHAVKLIVIPWKTPPPNSPEVGPGQENEPSPIPLLPFDGTDPNGESDFSVYPIAYRRLQFRIATANNGRRRELQQHFTLHLNVVATLTNGTKTNICETSTAPIVVRGRSPRNFQARKEIPLVGSSSSRGAPPDLQVVTSIGSGIAPIPAPVEKPRESRPQNMEPQRSATFTFDGNNLPPSPGVMRQSTYPTYLPSHMAAEHSTAPSTPGYQAPLTMDSYLQMNQSTQPNAGLSSPPSAVHQLPIRQQYTYSPTSSPSQNGPPLRFVDSNPRPAKSPRHIAPPKLPSNTPYADYNARFAPPYGSGNDVVAQRDAGYFPTSLPMQPWTTAPDTTGIYGAGMPAPAPNLQQQQHYQFPNEPYLKDENNPPHSYTWNT